MTSTGGTAGPKAEWRPVLVMGVLSVAGTLSLSSAETQAAKPPIFPIQAARGPASQISDEARWLAVRYAAEAEYHFFEAIRYEERAIQIDPVKDSRGTNRNHLLSEADFHWSRMIDLRTRAQLSRVEAAQQALR